MNKVERLEAIEAAARSVLDAFEAYGRSLGVVDSARAHQRCETTMLALAAAVDEDRYTITNKGREMLKGRERC